MSKNSHGPLAAASLVIAYRATQHPAYIGARRDILRKCKELTKDANTPEQLRELGGWSQVVERCVKEVIDETPDLQTPVGSKLLPRTLADCLRSDQAFKADCRFELQAWKARSLEGKPTCPPT